MEIRDSELCEATIPPTILARLRAVAAERGYDVGPWFAGTGVSPDQLTTPDARVSFRQATTVIRRALRTFPGEPIGLRVGARDARDAFGLLGFAIRSCKTAAEALELALELHRCAGSLLNFELTGRGEATTVQLQERMADPELLPFLCEEFLSAATLFSRSLLGEDAAPTRITVGYPKPDYSAEYQRIFRCPVVFDAPTNTVSFATRMLERKIATRNEANRLAAVEACYRLLDDGNARQDVVAAVEAIVAENLRSQITMVEVADRLCLTERTLRRQLNAAGERFNDIRDRVRQRRAAILLEETLLTVTQIAAETGYGDVREFRRAYVRWNGHPPSDFRRTHRTIPKARPH
ncbi:AraC family transcriptional regulator [Nocardia arthritidis]|uniref:Helix-turn-helix domain-containing protein n=1 Tax=Nocardia arthritidis TaxID=228602 RepID=A0A6G9YEF0_9NOCA|nr:AraC family transcriptional regulator [Nocardia arthritidis]QIS11544.1 helix-turn-helix domain-containing protein [Nocardia arthritidis]